MKNRPTILVVDDELPILEGLKRTLRPLREAWDLEFEQSSLNALEFAKANQVAVMICDKGMPELDGLELSQKMRKLSPDTRTIMLTGATDLDSAVAAINIADVFRFYTKPCETDILLDGIETALNLWQEEQTKASNSVDFSSIALEQTGQAIVIVDEKAKIVFTNSMGAAFLSEADGLCMDDTGILRASKPQETKKLHALVKSAAVWDVRSQKENMIAVERPSLKKSLSVAISSHEDGNRGYSVVLITDPEKPRIPSPESLATLLNLTGSEAKIAHGLALGEQLEDIARAANLTVSTARTYLKQVFQKTQTGRQAELVQLILTSCPPQS